MDGTRTAKLATVRSDGTPHVAPIAFVMDGDDILFVTAASSVKGKSLLRRGEVALAVDEENAPYPFVIIEGAATTSDDPKELQHFATAVGVRYVGAEQAGEFGRKNSGAGQILVRVRPTKVVVRLNGDPRKAIDLRK